MELIYLIGCYWAVGWREQWGGGGLGKAVNRKESIFLGSRDIWGHIYEGGNTDNEWIELITQGAQQPWLIKEGINNPALEVLSEGRVLGCSCLQGDVYHRRRAKDGLSHQNSTKGLGWNWGTSHSREETQKSVWCRARHHFWLFHQGTIHRNES